MILSIGTRVKLDNGVTGEIAGYGTNTSYPNGSGPASRIPYFVYLVDLDTSSCFDVDVNGVIKTMWLGTITATPDAIRREG